MGLNDSLFNSCEGLEKIGLDAQLSVPALMYIPVKAAYDRDTSLMYTCTYRCTLHMRLARQVLGRKCSVGVSHTTNRNERECMRQPE